MNTRSNKTLGNRDMSPIATELREFVAHERDNFEGGDNNRFAFAFGQVMRYSDFLAVIKDRYDQVNRKFCVLFEKRMTFLSGEQTPLSQEQLVSLEETSIALGALARDIELETESYYLFSKIMLDRVAHFLEYFFGAARKLSFDSHDQLTKNFLNYCAAKKLVKYENVADRLATLKKDIADFRDYQIAHEKSPRTIRGIHIGVPGETSMLIAKLYPKDSDPQVMSKNLSILQDDLCAYLRAIMSLIVTNLSRSKLKRKHVA